MYALFPMAFLQALGGSPMELAVIFVAILVLFGAKSLPQTLRTLGRWSEQLRRISQEIQREITEAEEPFRMAQRDLKEEMREAPPPPPARTEPKGDQDEG